MRLMLIHELSQIIYYQLPRPFLQINPPVLGKQASQGVPHKLIQRALGTLPIVTWISGALQQGNYQGNQS